MTKTTANIILIIIAGTWAYLSVQNGYFMPLSANLIQICAALAGGSGVIAAAEKWGGGK
jgi:hypothetical protein